jgi:hypothetical protein
MLCLRRVLQDCCRVALREFLAPGNGRPQPAAYVLSFRGQPGVMGFFSSRCHHPRGATYAPAIIRTSGSPAQSARRARSLTSTALVEGAILGVVALP